MRSLLRGWVCSCVVVMVFLGNVGMGAQSSAFRDSVVCGPNAVYMLLKTKGVTVPYEEILPGLPASNKGYSLVDLSSECAKHGLEVEVRQCGARDIKQLACSVPFIACIRSKTAGERLLHYVIILTIDHEGVLAIDGTTGERRRFSYDTLADFYWTGYVILTRNSQFDMVSACLLASSVVLLLAFRCVGVAR